MCATRTGGELMGLGGARRGGGGRLRVGQVREGFLADLLLVRGEPDADPVVLQDACNLAVIMQDGFIHKNTLGGGGGVGMAKL